MPGYRVPRDIFKDGDVLDHDRDRYVCSECELLLKDPIQLCCGHRLCKSCAEDISAQDTPTARCPLQSCKQKFAAGASYFPDESVKQEISSLPVICAFYKAGCKWEGKFHEYHQHKENCDIQVNLPSYKNGDVRPFRYMASFSPMNSLDGQQQDRQCDICRAPVRFCELKSHRESCLLQSVGQQCPLNLLGCPNDCYMDSDELKQHLKDNTYSHLSMLVNCIQLLEREITPVSALHHGVDESTDTRESNMLPQYEVKNFVSNGMQMMINKLKSPTVEKLPIQEEDIASLKSQDTKREKQIDLQSMNAELEDHDFRLCFLVENSNHDGSMIWKIPQFSQRRTDAENGKYTSVFSLPFYSGRYGYKMCLRLYINGDGIGKGTHLSLFFVVMRGEFDSILQWPFTHKVTFKLINQLQAGGRDIVNTFQPDPMSISFRKPKSEMNIASGCNCPQFVSHTELENGGFIADDTIFIKCSVDTSTIRHP